MDLFKNIKLRLYKFEAAIVLTGIVLLLVGGLVESSKAENMDSDVYEEKVQTVQGIAKTYSERYESQIERVLKGIDGVERLTVAVYVKNQGSSIPAINGSTDNSVITENNGESQAEENRNTKEESVVVVKDAQGNESAVILSETAPEIEGIAVCIEGGVSKQLEEKILKTLMALYGISPSKISITG